MGIDHIVIRKAKVHNLKEISLKIPKNTLTVITGPSGSGKSSLAFDTIYVEGQRRYIESLSSYARQFLGQYQPPDVESITGLSPAIAIDQKSTSRNPRSTVGTITEIYDYLRILFARVGTLYCPDSGQIIRSYSPSQIAKFTAEKKENAKLHILSPLSIPKKLNSKFFDNYKTQGYLRVKINDEILKIDEITKFSSINSLDLVIDRLTNKKENEKRLIDSIELALKLGHGKINILIDDDVYFFSEKNISPVTGEILPELNPKLFSFNSPFGACPKCNGIGESKVITKEGIIFDENLSILDGALSPVNKKSSFLYKMILSIAQEEKIDLSIPYKNLTNSFKTLLFEGSSKVYRYKFTSENSKFEFSKPFPGLISWLEKKYLESSSEKVRSSLEEYMHIQKCPMCKGDRLNQIALSTKINEFNIMDLANSPIVRTLNKLENIKLDGEKKIIADKLLKEILSRLGFLIDVGLEYLTLNRSAATLSGGESQRIRLATQIGSALSGVLYVLDEPSIGLHQRDNKKLISTMKKLRDLGNTVIVVEHDEETIREADHIIDIGPGAGIHGGKIVAQGLLSEIQNLNTITAKYLSGKKKISCIPKNYSPENFLVLCGASQNNLKSVDVKIPSNGLVCITGVSGSGKSTLIHQILVPALKNKIDKKNGHLYKRSNFQSLTGSEQFKSIIELDQSPIGRTPNSNPATYSGLFDLIRALFAKTPESQVRGYKQGRFSFNVKGGRCEECEGNGVKKIEMHFLPDVFVTCSECNGKRYNDDTLSVLYRGKNIADILELTIEEACSFFENHNKIKQILQTLNSIGLGYMKLGQSATTLSGGEAQRLKLAKELAKSIRGKCLYVLDEPTTGLHFEDINILLVAIRKLVDSGHAMIVIEHNLDVIKNSDWIIDLGPEGGEKGGTILFSGLRDELKNIKSSYTGHFLK
ncbi:MAG: excinuclease ABC subunit UvrA [Halobacteriovoraceae bacterium]|nr:excinuclease ABC subunit UvrA [Halobacteriovoraceae bacterium]